jgi:protein O-mannosyl-transferase
VSGAWTKLWAQPHFGMYIPVTSTIWAALLQLGGGATWPFRLLNIVLHLANVAMVATMLSAILRRWNLPSAAAVAIGAAIFALHPQQTATVSWISGARDLAAATFALAALAVHQSARIRHRVLWSSLLFACALLSKPSVVAVPVALVAYAWWFDRERFRVALWTGVGWTAMSLAAVLITRQAQSTMFQVDVPLLPRPFIALDAIGFYLIKTVWPLPLAADYGRRPDLVWSSPSMMIPTITATAMAGAALFFAIRRDPRYRIALLWLVILLPVLGIITSAYQRISTVADHYVYLPLAVVAAVVALTVARAQRMTGRAGWIVFGALVIGYAGVSLVRIGDWKDNQRFFDDMLRKNPRSFSAVINIAAVQCDRGNWQVGLATIQQTANLARTDAAFLANETYCLFRGNRFPEVFARQERLREPAVVASLDSNPAASAVLASSFAGAFLANDRPLKAFAYLCQAAAVAPQDLDVARNVQTAKEDLRRRGREVTCRGKIPWAQLEQIVRVLP